MISKNQINNLRALHLKKNRDIQCRFLAEGVKTVTELLELKPECVNEVYATADFLEQNKKKPGLNNIIFYEINQAELEKISLQSTPNKVVAVCNYFMEAHQWFDLNSNFSFYLDDIRDPGNFGTIIRLADWFGISSVFCSPQSCDFYNPKVIQSSMGAFIRIKCIYVDLNKLLAEQKVTHVYGAVLNGKNLYKESLKPGLVLIGNEANGISEKNLKLVNYHLTIPGAVGNGAESLNAAMAASIIAGEFYRQLSK